MSFVDQITIRFKAGNGGNGCTAFDQQRYQRYPRPSGGDGGDGGDVMLITDSNVATLLDFKFRHEFKAGRGQHGSGNGKTGKRGKSETLRVPVGTVIWDDQRNLLIRDLSQDGQELIVAKGGRGGFGNLNAREALEGSPGQDRRIRLELKLIADVGIVGLPNAGKSSLLSRISTAKPAIGNYPFTTRYPVLGVVQMGLAESFVACDIPGLIEDAHIGRGLGIQFLRHIERTRILIHMVDLSCMDNKDPVAAYYQVNKELACAEHSLDKKPQLVAANKIDLPQTRAARRRLEQAVGETIYPISCVTGEGVEALMQATWIRLRKKQS